MVKHAPTDFCMMFVKEDYLRYNQFCRRFWENPVGIITVGVAVGLYFLLFVYARRKDKLSKLKVRVCLNSSSSLFVQVPGESSRYHRCCFLVSTFGLYFFTYANYSIKFANKNYKTFCRRSRQTWRTICRAVCGRLHSASSQALESAQAPRLTSVPKSSVNC